MATKIKRKTVSVSVSRTVQITQYHPSTVTVTEEAEIPEGMTHVEVKEVLYKSASASVVKFMNNEIDKWSKE
jgi:hypothetical protein